jgi:hypothetical protein
MPPVDSSETCGNPIHCAKTQFISSTIGLKTSAILARIPSNRFFLPPAGRFFNLPYRFNFCYSALIERTSDGGGGMRALLHRIAAMHELSFYILSRDCSYRV